MKQRIKRIISYIMVFVMVLSSIQLTGIAKAKDVYASDDFVIKDGVLIKYYGTDKEVVIPEGVTSIGDFAFSGRSSLTSITIPKGITSIGSCAFSGCSSLTSITIPESVTSIVSDAFSYCSSLTVYGTSGSYVEEYCKNHDNLTFIAGEMPTHTPGDINGDDKVNLKDVTRLKQYLLGWRVKVVEQALDVNGDGKVNLKDVTRLKQHLLGWKVTIH